MESLFKCPDCGSTLAGIDIEGVEKAYRCFLCGGVWLMGNGKNGLPEKSVGQWTTVRVDPAMMKFGDNSCPVDGNKLIESQEDMTKGLPVKRCQNCKWWWFPTDSLFLYDPSGTRGMNFDTMWRSIGALVFVGILMVGTVTSVRLVIERQQTKISASNAIRNYSYTYLGKGIVKLSFESNEELFSVAYRTAIGEWTYAPVTKSGGVYIFTIADLKENTAYEVKLGNESYFFVTKL